MPGYTPYYTATDWSNPGAYNYGGVPAGYGVSTSGVGTYGVSAPGYGSNIQASGGMSAMGMSSLYGAAAQGISNYFGQQSRNRQAQMMAQGSIDEAHAAGEQNRQSALYSALLDDYYNQQGRYRKSQAYGNWVDYARGRSPSRFRTLEKMLGMNSTQLEDPGAPPEVPKVPDYKRPKKGK